MPYSSESREKNTHLKENESDNVDEPSQYVEPGNVSASSSYEGEEISVRQKYGSITDSFFSFIREEHLQEAREFRRKRYNIQIPVVDLGLVTQLREALAAAKSRIGLRASVRGPLGTLWLLEQIGQIERFTDRLSDDHIQEWTGVGQA